MVKKINMVSALICLASVATAQTVTLGTFGYASVNKPAGELNLVGNSFGGPSSALSEVVSLDSFNGDALLASADRVIIWDPVGDQYTTYAVYDDSGYGGSTKEWRDASDFYGSAVDPIIPSGSAFWVQSSGSVSDSQLTVSGNVILLGSVTNQIVQGLQMMSYPFSAGVELNASMLKDGATGDALLASSDRVIAWDVVAQGYETFALYDDSGYGGSTREWRDAADFYNPAGIINVDLGKGFWYEAQNNFTWVEDNPYVGSL